VEHGSASYSQPRAVLLHPGSQSGHDLHACGRPWRSEKAVILIVKSVVDDDDDIDSVDAGDIDN